MFVILYYDINEKRVSKVLKICRKYLTWVQNSVFEGEITKANLKKLKSDLKSKTKEEDSIIIYEFRSMSYSKREVIGIDKKEDTNFI
ncbi:MAG: CRISPR-associated endonuclease Cas2 [Fusobacteriia bacterium 4572_132]|nr:MAG: CRISPR-associated endonuclease Cas2 [Fusobacteriia bacterium 4572_132]